MTTLDELVLAHKENIGFKVYARHKETKLYVSAHGLTDNKRNALHAMIRGRGVTVNYLLEVCFIAAEWLQSYDYKYTDFEIDSELE